MALQIGARFYESILQDLKRFYEPILQDLKRLYEPILLDLKAGLPCFVFLFFSDS